MTTMEDKFNEELKDEDHQFDGSRMWLAKDCIEIISRYKKLRNVPQRVALNVLIYKGWQQVLAELEVMAKDQQTRRDLKIQTKNEKCN